MEKKTPQQKHPPVEFLERSGTLVSVCLLIKKKWNTKKAIWLSANGLKHCLGRLFFCSVWLTVGVGGAEWLTPGLWWVFGFRTFMASASDAPEGTKRHGLWGGDTGDNTASTVNIIRQHYQQKKCQLAVTRVTLIKSLKTRRLARSFVTLCINHRVIKGDQVASWFLCFEQWKIGENHNRGNFSNLVSCSSKCAATFLIDNLCLLKLKWNILSPLRASTTSST